MPTTGALEGAEFCEWIKVPYLADGCDDGLDFVPLVGTTNRVFQTGKDLAAGKLQDASSHAVMAAFDFIGDMLTPFTAGGSKVALKAAETGAVKAAESTAETSIAHTAVHETPRAITSEIAKAKPKAAFSTVANFVKKPATVAAGKEVARTSALTAAQITSLDAVDSAFETEELHASIPEAENQHVPTRMDAKRERVHEDLPERPHLAPSYVVPITVVVLLLLIALRG